LATAQTGGVHALGLDREDLLPGLKKGLAWSAAFAAVAGLLILGLSLAGQSPLTWIRSPLPVPGSQRGLFFLVGGIIALLAEEVVFRGLIFGYLRRWGVSTAVLVSTALFAAIHPWSVLPVTQIVGGLVFAVAYHTSGSLMTPITIHTLGNLAIFTLSLPRFH
ncbi:MAG: CPBP family intramembrane glutamic endopeptidase, partial [Desulfosarcina sp.]